MGKCQPQTSPSTGKSALCSSSSFILVSYFNFISFSLVTFLRLSFSLIFNVSFPFLIITFLFFIPVYSIGCSMLISFSFITWYPSCISSSHHLTFFITSFFYHFSPCSPFLHDYVLPVYYTTLFYISILVSSLLVYCITCPQNTKESMLHIC